MTARWPSSNAAAHRRNSQRRSTSARIADQDRTLSRSTPTTRATPPWTDQRRRARAEAAMATAKLQSRFTEVRRRLPEDQPRAADARNLVQTDQDPCSPAFVSQDPVLFIPAGRASFLALSRARPQRRTRRSDKPGAGGASLAKPASAFGHGELRQQPGRWADRHDQRAPTVPNPDGVFVPGLYARVQLEGRAEYMRC